MHSRNSRGTRSVRMLGWARQRASWPLTRRTRRQRWPLLCSAVSVNLLSTGIDAKNDTMRKWWEGFHEDYEARKESSGHVVTSVKIQCPVY